jgi:hypothetical protein
MSLDLKTIITAAVAGGIGAAVATYALSKQRAPAASAQTSATEVDAKVRDAVLAQAQAIAGSKGFTSKVYPAVGKPAKQRRVLVTGGAGFVGSNLVDALMMQVSRCEGRKRWGPPPSFCPRDSRAAPRSVAAAIRRFCVHIPYLSQRDGLGRRRAPPKPHIVLRCRCGG